MEEIGKIVSLLGFVIVLSTMIIYVFRLRNFKKAMNAYNPKALFDIGLDTSTDIFGPQFGTKEAQDFIYKRAYLKHPDPIVVSTAHRAYICLVLTVGGLIVIATGILINAMSGI